MISPIFVRDFEEKKPEGTKLYIFMGWFKYTRDLCRWELKVSLAEAVLMLVDGSKPRIFLPLA